MILGLERERKNDKRNNQIVSLASVAHTIARNKLQARWKNYTPTTQARKINTRAWRISY